MSNYSKTTDFAAKDSLPSGDSGKIIRGSEFETEFDNISTAIATKADAADPTFTGTVTIDGLTVNGNTTLGNAATDTVTVTADIASNLIPSADDTYNLGASGAEWNDLFIDGTANIDSLVADTADINGGTIDGVTIGGSSAGAITGTTITGTGFVTSGDMTFGDNDKAVFGAGSDLQIFHDGSNSRIKDNGTGGLYVQGSSFISLTNAAATETYVYAAENGAVQLKYDNSTKLATTSTGVDVTGTVTSDGLTVQGESYFDTNNGSRALHITRYGTVESESANFTIDDNDLIVDSVQDEQYGGYVFKATRNGVGTVNRLAIENNGDISFYEDTGTTAKFFWDASAERLGIGTSSPQGALSVSNGGAEGIEIDYTGGTMRIVSFDRNAVTDSSLEYRASEHVFKVSTSEKMRIDASGNVGIGTDSPTTNLDIAAASSTTLTVRNTSTVSSILLANGSSANQIFSRGANSSTGRDLAFVQGTSEAMRINSSGTLLVGKSSSGFTTAGHEINADGLLVSTRDGDNVVVLNRETNDGSILQFRKDNSTVGSIGTNSGSLFIGSGDTGLNMRADLNAIYPWGPTGGAQPDVIDLGYSTVPFKDLYLSGGAYLGGTAAANKLDDYEEGTWSPVFVASSGAFTTMTMDVISAKYTKIGSRVICAAYVSTDEVTVGTASGALRLSGLPFTANEYAAAHVGYSVGWAGENPLSGYTENNNAFISLQFRTIADGSVNPVLVSDLTTGAVANKNRMMIAVAYFTSS